MLGEMTLEELESVGKFDLGEKGRVIIFDPAVSLMSMAVYGLFHHEPLNLKSRIGWDAPEHFRPEDHKSQGCSPW